MKALGWLYWAVYQAIDIVLFPVGVVLVGIASLCGAWERRNSKYPYADGRNRWQWKWSLLWLWCNEEDGITYFGKGDPDPKSAFAWCAWRNRVNNMRTLPGAFFVCDSAKLTFKDYPFGYVATQGWRQCVMVKGFRFGWLIPRTASTGSPAWPVISFSN